MQFDSVSIIKKANVYFDGKVTSRTVLFSDGSKKTLGIMMPGQYTFGTEAAEEMEVLGGSMNVQLKGEDRYTRYEAGQTFSVPAHSEFKLDISDVADYCCSYLD